MQMIPARELKHAVNTVSISPTSYGLVTSVDIISGDFHTETITSKTRRWWICREGMETLNLSQFTVLRPSFKCSAKPKILLRVPLSCKWLREQARFLSKCRAPWTIRFWHCRWEKLECDYNHGSMIALKGNPPPSSEILLIARISKDFLFTIR